MVAVSIIGALLSGTGAVAWVRTEFLSRQQDRKHEALLETMHRHHTEHLEHIKRVTS